MISQEILDKIILSCLPCHIEKFSSLLSKYAYNRRFKSFDDALQCDTLQPIEFEYLYQRGIPHNISDYHIALHHSGYLEWNEKYHHTNVPVVAHDIYISDAIITDSCSIYNTMYVVPIESEPIFIDTKKHNIRIVNGNIDIVRCVNLFLDSASNLVIDGTICIFATDNLTKTQCFGTCYYCKDTDISREN